MQEPQAQTTAPRRATVLAGLPLVLALACQGAAFAARPATFRDCVSAESPGAPSPVRGFSAYGGAWRVDDAGVLHSDGGPGPKLVADAPELTAGTVGVEVLLPDASAGNAGLILKVGDCTEGPDSFNGYEVALNGDGRLTFGRHRQNWHHIRDVPVDVPLNRSSSLFDAPAMLITC